MCHDGQRQEWSLTTRQLQMQVPASIQKQHKSTVPLCLGCTRVGDWRILYAVDRDQLVIMILKISPRGDAHKR